MSWRASRVEVGPFRWWLLRRAAGRLSPQPSSQMDSQDHGPGSSAHGSISASYEASAWTACSGSASRSRRATYSALASRAAFSAVKRWAASVARASSSSALPGLVHTGPDAPQTVRRSTPGTSRSRVTRPRYGQITRGKRGPGGAGGARTHDRRIMRSTVPRTMRASCTDDTGYRTDGARRAGII